MKLLLASLEQNLIWRPKASVRANRFAGLNRNCARGAESLALRPVAELCLFADAMLDK